MRALLRTAWARLRGFLRPGEALDDFDEEIRAHLDMATEDKIRQGLSPTEARRQARVELGNLTQLRDATRDARGLPWLGSSWLDLKLGLRKLRKTWGLSLVAGLAMTVVITLAVVVFDVMATFTSTELPLDEDHRIVALQSWDRKLGDGIGASVEDFEHWRRELRSVETPGAFRAVERNLQASETHHDDRPAEAVAVAEITASGFELARVAPVLGRPLLPGDEPASAEPVLVIGQEVWHSRFAADPQILGRRVRLDGTPHTIVGVMPRGFGFPLYHRYWVPLRTAPSSYAPDVGARDLFVFARLGEGTTLASAQSELRRVGRAGPPDPAGLDIELRAVPYVTAFTGEVDAWMVRIVLLLVSLLLVPPSINIAILVYARTVTRQGEFAARYVLGASRFNIVAQLFLEMWVLAIGAGAVALGVARLVVWQLVDDMHARGNPVPFWMDFELSAGTVLFVAGLAVVAATLAGAVPALRATGRSMPAGLRSLSGQTAVSLGGTWTVLIVLQVAFSFALLPTAVELTWGTLRSGLLGPGFAAEEYLTARLELSTRAPESEPGGVGEGRAARFADRQSALVGLLTAEPEIAAVTLSSQVPGDEPWVRVETEESAAAEDRSPGIEVGTHDLARVNQVDSAFFDVFELPILTGRGFEPGDFDTGRNAVIVNRSFVDNVLEGREPLGRRIRYRTLDRETEPHETRPDRWLEIVGVSADLQRHASVQTIYHPAPPTTAPAVSLALRVRSDPTVAAGTLRATTWGLDPALRVTQIRRLDEIYRQKAVGDYLGASGLVAATLSVLLLSAAGIYALMLFTVNRRRKEIGIRLALGASPTRLLAGVFGRALGKVGLGAAAGVAVALLIGYYIPVESLGGREVGGVLPGATLSIVLVAFLALVGPARRGLRVQPVDELKSD